MTDTTHTQDVTKVHPAVEPMMDFAAAKSTVAKQQRRELVVKVRELRRQSDGAQERARKARDRFEHTVALLASERPERPDWYEHPGALPRKALLEAAGLTTMALHRVMSRHQAKPKRAPRKRAAK